MISWESSVNPSINPPISHTKTKWNQTQVGSLPPKYDLCGKCARNLDTHTQLCLLLPLKWQRPSKTIKEWSPEHQPLYVTNLSWVLFKPTQPSCTLGRFGLGFDGSSGRTIGDEATQKKMFRVQLSTCSLSYRKIVYDLSSKRCAKRKRFDAVFLFWLDCFLAGLHPVHGFGPSTTV